VDGSGPFQGIIQSKAENISMLPDGQHCPDLNDTQLGKQVTAEMLKYARGRNK